MFRNASVFVTNSFYKIWTLQAMQDWEISPRVMRFCNDTWMVHRKALCWCSCAIRSIMGTSQRCVWRARMRISQNVLRHQQVRVYFINTLMFVLLLKTSTCHIRGNGRLTRSSLTPRHPSESSWCNSWFSPRSRLTLRSRCDVEVHNEL